MPPEAGAPGVAGEGAPGVAAGAPGAVAGVVREVVLAVQGVVPRQAWSSSRTLVVEVWCHTQRRGA